ncbi:hypothetical protein F4803DRAFT_565233 [Xylaria telfairii]|nr:hypothetical protein F4803DRAFT_565233 [Xylaria telfairii]
MASEKSPPVNKAAQIKRPVVPGFLRLHSRNHQAWEDVAKREEAVLQRSMNLVMIDPKIRPRDKILLRMRTDAEAYTPSTITFPSGQINSQVKKAALGCYNTIIALYCFDDRQQFPYILAMDIEDWLWRQWFRPYIPDIDVWRTFVKIFAVRYDVKGYRGSEAQRDLDGLISPHCNILLNRVRIWDQTITTTLGIAIKFVLRFEQREVAAFGIQPDINSLAGDVSPPWILKYREDAKMLGWVEGRDGSLQNLSPRNSEWVDRTLFSRWLRNANLITRIKRYAVI